MRDAIRDLSEARQWGGVHHGTGRWNNTRTSSRKAGRLLNSGVTAANLPPDQGSVHEHGCRLIGSLADDHGTPVPASHRYGPDTLQERICSQRVMRRWWGHRIAAVPLERRSEFFRTAYASIPRLSASGSTSVKPTRGHPGPLGVRSDEVRKSDSVALSRAECLGWT